jgi:hypothetical protein
MVDAAADTAALRRLNRRLKPHGLEVVDSGTRGRSLLAARAFIPGDCVLSSVPYASAPFPQLAPMRCGACFERPSAGSHLMRCGACKRASVCSTACQRLSWSAGHQRCVTGWYLVPTFSKMPKA